MNLQKLQNSLSWIASTSSLILGAVILLYGNFTGVTFLLIGIAMLPPLKLPELVRIAAAIVGVFII